MTAKIWLSVGIFILGYVFSTALSQVQGHAARASLRATATARFPAAQLSQQAEAAFERMVKGFGDAVIMQDASKLEQAADDGRSAIAAWKSVASITGLRSDRIAEAGTISASLEQVSGDAKATYGAVLGGTMSASTQDQMRSLAARTDELKAKMAKERELLAADLRTELNALEASSSSQNTVSLVLFIVTLILAGAIVHTTIHRSITTPVRRVIGGVQEATDEVARAAAQMKHSGDEVSSGAQEQAACVEETSASLEEISGTTQQNANRAGEADRLMQTARQTVERAAQAMNDLTTSMSMIAKSSKQVSVVLKNIDEIAFHTNILALNAAVEAARAGEAGAGFSVVADEVRSLAHRAAEAARDSGTIIEQTMGDVTRGVELVDHAQTAFAEVSSTINAGTQVMSQIASSSAEQARGIMHIGKAILQIETLARRSVESAQQTAEGATAMSSQVDETRKYLSELVAVVG